MTEADAAATRRQHGRQIAGARRARKRAVRLAVATGGTVPFDLRTLLADGHSINTIRKVMR